jgi:pyocin large subunit-like protein
MTTARGSTSVLGLFLSADTIVPDGKNPQAFNRYSYVGNRPLNFTDPTGHYSEAELIKMGVVNGPNTLQQMKEDLNYSTWYWLLRAAFNGG